VEGRTADYLRLPDGRWLHPYLITDTVMPIADWIRQHQLIQERQDRIVLQVIPFRRPTGEEIQQVERTVREVLTSGVEFHVVLVSEIKRGPGGKFQLARSLIHSAG